jgi:hypothetical protein
VPSAEERIYYSFSYFSSLSPTPRVSLYADSHPIGCRATSFNFLKSRSLEILPMKSNIIKSCVAPFQSLCALSSGDQPAFVFEIVVFN